MADGSRAPASGMVTRRDRRTGLVRALAVLTLAALVVASPMLSTDAAALVGLLESDSSPSGSAEPSEATDEVAGGDNWAPVDEATITPGARTITGESGQCTANFVFTDGHDVYLGQAAHCASTAGPTATNGCRTDTLPLGTEVAIEGADHPGTLAYSSWTTMKAVDETDVNACRFNDFALVRVHPDDRDKINPSVPAFGGPDGLNTAGTRLSDAVYAYGDSQFRLGIEPLSPKQGFSNGTSAGGWNHNVYLVTPGVPGDSGGPVLDKDGNALGVLSTVMAAPSPGSNDVTDLSRALAYANHHTDADVRLVPGTRGFRAR